MATAQAETGSRDEATKSATSSEGGSRGGSRTRRDELDLDVEVYEVLDDDEERAGVSLAGVPH